MGGASIPPTDMPMKSGGHPAGAVGAGEDALDDLGARRERGRLGDAEREAQREEDRERRRDRNDGVERGDDRPDDDRRRQAAPRADAVDEHARERPGEEVRDGEGGAEPAVGGVGDGQRLGHGRREDGERLAIDVADRHREGRGERDGPGSTSSTCVAPR